MTEAPEEIVDSPVGWVAKHVRSYLETDGGTGHEFYGHPALLLTTRGRRTGILRRTALYYGESDAAYVVVASNGGSKDHPQWYRNLRADPDVVVQVRGEIFRASARTATGPERDRLWALMVGVFPTYQRYQERAPREIPVVVLEPSG